MKRWLRFSLWAAAALTGLVIIIFVAFGWLFSIPPRSYQKDRRPMVFSNRDTAPSRVWGESRNISLVGGVFLRKNSS